MLRTWLTVGLLAAVGCSGDSVTGNPEDLEFAPELGVDLSQMTRTASGLYWQDLVVGTGEEAMPGDEVSVFYTGWLADGTRFDWTEEEPRTFSLMGVILGWQEGIPGMRVGGKRKLVIPPQLAYGNRAVGGVIPPNATLVFDIELVEVNP